MAQATALILDSTEASVPAIVRVGSGSWGRAASFARSRNVPVIGSRLSARVLPSVVHGEARKEDE